MQFTYKIFLAVAFIKAATSKPILESPPETSGRIVNGNAVDIRDVPYQAAIHRRLVTGWSHHCGAVLVSNRIILSAAHCTISYETSPSTLRVVVGTSERLTGGTAYDVNQIINHEEYNPNTLEHDISMLVTRSTITLSDSVRPVSIAATNMVLKAGFEATVSGFGAIASDGPSSSALLAAQVQIVDQATCARAYLPIAAITDGMLCAAGVSPPRDACQGDSGGPLVADDTLIGIVSWGEGCADESFPGVYVRISEYREWIVLTSSGLVQ